MTKAKSKKIKSWSKKDVFLNVLVYVINTIILMAMFIGAAAVHSLVSNESFFEYISDFKEPLHLFVQLISVVVIMVVYFFFEDRNFLRKAANSQMLFLIMEISLVINFVCGRYVNIYLRPLAMAGLLVLFLTKHKKDAIFVNILFSVLVFLLDSFTNTSVANAENIAGVIIPVAYSALIVGLLSGVIGVFLESKVFSRTYLLLYSLVIGIPATLLFVSAYLEYGVKAVQTNFVVSLISAMCSGLLSGVMILFLLPIFEVMFRRVTCFKLAELTDHKSRLVKKMITEAPGTFNHSIIVSNLAEACAVAIGEDSLLARTCAYYHDVGKLRRPEFFTENQVDGVNPHNDLTPELSTNIIRSHAVDGYQLVLKNRLPKEIADVCIEHHGTLPIFFFYDKAKKFTDGEVDIAKYSYLGPIPQTKISAIIMICDGCEAATRTLIDRSRESVTKVVRKIVSDRMAMGQFDECEITLKEINIIINTIINSLTGVYHSRVEYPAVTLEGIKEDKEELTAIPQSILPTGEKKEEEKPAKRSKKKKTEEN